MRYVIVGAGPAGISAARPLRQLDKDGDIILVLEDNQVHSRCMHHKYLSGKLVVALNGTWLAQTLSSFDFSSLNTTK